MCPTSPAAMSGFGETDSATIRPHTEVIGNRHRYDTKQACRPAGGGVHLGRMVSAHETLNIYFSDQFGVSPEQIEAFGAFNISLVTDLPLFIDPFLLFNSENPEYQELHEDIIRYLRFLRDKAAASPDGLSLSGALYRFPEIRQTWLGFTRTGNEGLGLGKVFGQALQLNLAAVFRNFGSEKITRSSHLEKLCLIAEGVGNDRISDFTTNLIHGYLLRYTERFAKKHIKNPELIGRIAAQRVHFSYETESWEPGVFSLPRYRGDYVLLTPKDMLTKDDTWINRGDLLRDFESIPDALPGKQLRDQVNNYFRKRLPKDATAEERASAAIATIAEFPVLIDAFIKRKEDTGSEAENISRQKVALSIDLYVRQFGELAQLLQKSSDFYRLSGTTYDEAYRRVLFFKDVIEHKGGHRLFYVKGRPVERETDLHVAYRLTWFSSFADVTREANDGRGPVDFKVSYGSADKTLVEFKLATNSQLKRNLRRQAPIYERASDAKRTIKVIFYFTAAQLQRVQKILKELELVGDKDIVLVDARKDNKPSASKA